MRPTPSCIQTLATPLRHLSPARAALLVVLVLAGCAPDAAEDESASLMVPLYFEPIGYGQRASLADTLEVAIRDPETWRAVQDSLDPVAPFDSVDFSQAFVLLAAIPQRTSGYSVEFASVDEIDRHVAAEYVVNVPAEDCLTAYARTVPFQAVLVRRTDAPVRFTHTTEEYRCTFGPRRRGPSQ